ncbi:MAG: aminotransferase class IV [Phycisphaerales bacterium JB039]
MPPCYLNGRIVDLTEARIAAMDAGLQHAVGLFETMIARTTDGEVHVTRLEAHLDRLSASAAELGLAETVRTGPLADAVKLTVERSQLPRARVRLTLTGGDLNLLTRECQRTAREPTILIVVQPAPERPGPGGGVSAVIAGARANPLNPLEGHKTLSYWWRLRELQAAAAKGAGEAIVFQVTNYLCGGAVSNIFCVKDGRLITPIARGEEREVARAGAAAPSPVLPGVTRAAVIEIANSRGIGVERRMVSVDDVMDADEVFCTNASWGVLPILRIEQKQIGAGEPGPVARDLGAALDEAG